MEVEGQRGTKKKKKSMFAVFLGLLVTSLCGGLLLTWWLFKYHETNAHLWMVPPGLVLFLTPVVVSISVFFSDFCDDTDDHTQRWPERL